MRKKKVSLEWLPTITLVAIFCSMVQYKKIKKKMQRKDPVEEYVVKSPPVEDSDAKFWSDQEKCSEISLKEICKKIEYITLLNPDQGLYEHNDKLFFYLTSDILKLKKLRFAYSDRDLKLLKNKLKSDKEITKDYKHPNSVKDEEDWITIGKMIILESGIAEYALRNKKKISLILNKKSEVTLSKEDQEKMYYAHKYWGSYAIMVYKFYLHSFMINPLKDVFIRSLSMNRESRVRSENSQEKLVLTEGREVVEFIKKKIILKECAGEHLKVFCSKIDSSTLIFYHQNTVYLSINNESLDRINKYSALLDQIGKKKNIPVANNKFLVNRLKEIGFISYLKKNTNYSSVVISVRSDFIDEKKYILSIVKINI